MCTFCTRSLPACENVTKAELLDWNVRSREAATGSRTCENSCRHRHDQFHFCNKPCSARIHLIVLSADRDVGVGRDVGLLTCGCLV